MAPKRSPKMYTPVDWKNAPDSDPGKQTLALEKSHAIEVPVAKPSNTKPFGGTYASAASKPRIEANSQDQIIVPGVSRSSTLSNEGTWASTARTAAEKQASSELEAKTKSAIEKQASGGHRAMTTLKRGDAAASSEEVQATAIRDSPKPSAANIGTKKQVQILKRSHVPPMKESQIPPVPNAPASSTASRAYNAFVTKEGSVHGSDKPYDEAWTAEEPYSMPPSSPTGRPEGLDSDSDTPIFNLNSRLRTSVAEGTKKLDSPSGLLEHLADPDVVESKPRVYLGSGLEGDAGFSSGDQPVRAKGKGKLYEMAEVADQSDGRAQAPGLETVCHIFGFPIGENETQLEYKEEIMHAVDGAIQHLRSTLNRNPAVLQKLESTFQEASKHRSKRLAEVVEELKRTSKNGENFLSNNTKLPEDKRAVVQASVEMMRLSEAEITWRAEAMEQWQRMMEMEVALRRAKLVPPKTEYLNDRLNTWVQDKPKGGRKFDLDSYTKNRRSLVQSLQANDIEDTGLPQFINADHKWAAKILEQRRSPELAAAILEEAEVKAFLTSIGTSGGLLVMGSNLQTYKQPRTDLTGFAVECCKVYHNKKGFWGIKHFAGLRTLEQAEKHLTQYSGVAGLLRSICQQLIVIARSTANFDVVDTWSADSMSAVYEGDVQMLCRLFRHLLIEITTASQRKNDRHTVILIVNSIHVLELDEHRAEFYQAVDYFRDLCDETMIGDLGDTLKFQYMFLHNGISRLILKPCPRERIVIHKTWESK